MKERALSAVTKSTTSCTSGLSGVLLGGPAHPLLQVALALEHLAEGGAQAVDVVALGAAPLKPDEVQPGEMRPLADDRAVGDDVGDDAGHAADHRAAAEAHELVHGRRGRRGSRRPRRRTCPPRVALLAMITWLPMLQSCATCVAIMKRLSSPTRVTPPPPSVPGFMVTCSRMRLRAPMTSSTRSPWNFRSCGMWPIEAKGKIDRLLADRGAAGHDHVAVQHHARRRAPPRGRSRSRARCGSPARSRRRPR